MVIKGYSKFPKASVLEPHHQMVKCHVQDTHWGERVLPLCRDAVDIFYSTSSQLSFIYSGYTSCNGSKFRIAWLVKYSGDSVRPCGPHSSCKDLSETSEMLELVYHFESPYHPGFFLNTMITLRIQSGAISKGRSPQYKNISACIHLFSFFFFNGDSACCCSLESGDERTQPYNKKRESIGTCEESVLSLDISPIPIPPEFLIVRSGSNCKSRITNVEV